MANTFFHSWNPDKVEAKKIQLDLREYLNLTWDNRNVKLIGGVDASNTGNNIRAAIVLLSFPELELLEDSVAECLAVMPYLPGLLAFREGPAVLAAWKKMRTKPDLLIFDGQGIAHPLHLGIASHLGLLLDVPSVGVAKSRLYGRYANPDPTRGAYSFIYDEKERDYIIGGVLRTRDNTRPVFVSPGHKIDVNHAIQWVLACCKNYRLPEPIRHAHRIAGSNPNIKVN